jgi:hypothetical protein
VNDRPTITLNTGKKIENVEGSGGGLFSGTISAFSWMELDEDSNPGPPKYEAAVLTTKPQLSVPTF